MFTSDIKMIRRNTLKTALIYLFASIICAVFGAVYEVFSHGVYSYLMIYAFAIPLICGVLPFLLLHLAFSRITYKGRNRWNTGELQFMKRVYPSLPARSLYHCGILTFTVGSLMAGVLEIYGTTNQIINVYWFAGAAAILTATTIYVISLLSGDRRKKVSETT